MRDLGLYDEAHGPHNPHVRDEKAEWFDPTGELAVILITRADIITNRRRSRGSERSGPGLH